LTPVSCNDIVFPRMIDFTMPRYGFMQKGTVARWFKREGEQVSRGELIVQIESDKVVNDVESPADGYLKKIVVPEGAEQDVFKSIAFIAESREELERELQIPASVGQHQATPGKAARPALESESSGAVPAGAARASPVARRLARENHVDLAAVKGTGPGGRITEKDVQLHLREMGGQQEAAVSEEVLSPTRRAVARHLSEGLQRSALVTQSLLCRCGALVAVKQSSGASISAVLVKLLGAALGEFPRLNAHLLDDVLKIHREVNVGVAVHAGHGLTVPVVRNVRAASLAAVQEQLKSLADRARQRSLNREELQGSTFTLSNLGMYRTDTFTPILNFPEVGILGVGRIFKDVHVDEAEATSIVPKVWLSLTYDHRAIDGGEAASFLGRLEELLADGRKLSQAVL